MTVLAILSLVFFKVTHYFPTELFFTLTLLILIVNELKQSGFTAFIAYHVERRLRDKSPWKQYLGLCLMGTVISSIGIGNIVGVSLLAPLTQQLIHRLHLKHSHAFLLLILGVNAGALSPITPTSMVIQTLLAKTHFHLSPWGCYLSNGIGHYIAVFFILIVMEGFRSHIPESRGPQNVSFPKSALNARAYRALLALSLIAVLPIVLHLSLLISCAIAISVVLISTRTFHLDWKSVPWNVVLLLCSMSGLAFSLYDKGYFLQFGQWLTLHMSGLFLLTSLVFFAAFASIFASSSAVVLPVFIILVASLESISHAQSLGLMYAIIFCAHIVDVSPFSTLGALALATEQDLQSQQGLRKELTLASFLLALGSGIMGCAVLAGID